MRASPRDFEWEPSETTQEKILLFSRGRGPFDRHKNPPATLLAKGNRGHGREKVRPCSRTKEEGGGSSRMAPEPMENAGSAIVGPGQKLFLEERKKTRFLSIAELKHA